MLSCSWHQSVHAAPDNEDTVIITDRHVRLHVDRYEMNSGDGSALEPLVLFTLLLVTVTTFDYYYLGSSLTKVQMSETLARLMQDVHAFTQPLESNNVVH